MNATGPRDEGAFALIADEQCLAHAIARLGHEDACALPWIETAACARLVAALDALSFRKARPVVGEGERAVFQDFDICMKVPADHRVHELRRLTEAALQRALQGLDHEAIATPFALNDVVVQRYPPGSAGISPHRDHLRYVGLVALVLLGGDGIFSVCADRGGAGERAIPAVPGDLILMRAPSLFGRKDRPFHRLRAITRSRITVGLRHDTTKPLGEGLLS